MAETVRSGLHAMLVEAAGAYPAAVRYGGGYWSEMVGNASGHMADVLEALIALGTEPQRSRETLTDLMERTRQYLIASGSTFERMLLDFNQALVKLSRLYPSPPLGGGRGDEGVGDDRTVGVFRQLADFAASEAMRLQFTPGRPDVDALRQHLHACLAELQRLEGPPGPAASAAG